MTCQVTATSRTCSTSRIQREVIQAKGQRGSNQKSAACPCRIVTNYRRFRVGGHESVTAPDIDAVPHRLEWQDARHAWNQPDPRGGADPRRHPLGRVVHRRPRPHRLRQGLREHHRAPFHLLRARCQHVRRPGRRDHPRGRPQRREAGRVRRLPRQPHPSRRPPGGQRAARALRAALQPHRRGPAPVRRPRRRQGLPLQPVRGAGRPPRVHDVRAAGPQVAGSPSR